MPMSQVFGVKSNAARAAKKYGLTRDHLQAVSGGWCFELPEETAAPAMVVEPVGAPVTQPEPAIAELAPDDEAANMVPGAWREESEVQPEPAAPEPLPTAPAKPERARKAATPKAPKAAAPNAKDAAPKKAANKAPTSGKGAEVFTMIKARWTPVSELLKKTGWLPHTLRGYISRIAKAEGWTLEHRRDKGITSYRIAV